MDRFDIVSLWVFLQAQLEQEGRGSEEHLWLVGGNLALVAHIVPPPQQPTEKIQNPQKIK
jgi:hypothetical protein